MSNEKWAIITAFKIYPGWSEDMVEWGGPPARLEEVAITYSYGTPVDYKPKGCVKVQFEAYMTEDMARQMEKNGLVKVV